MNVSPTRMIHYVYLTPILVIPLDVSPSQLVHHVNNNLIWYSYRYKPYHYDIFIDKFNPYDIFIDASFIHMTFLLM